MTNSVRAVLLVAVVVVAFAGGLALADAVYLHDGRVIRGTIKSPDDAPIVEIDTPMGLMRFRRPLVQKVEKGEPVDVAPPATQPVESAEPPTVADDPAPAEVGKLDPQARARYAEALKLAAQAASGPEGLAVWEQFLKEFPSGPQADLANKELAGWKDRADKNLVRFGPAWQPKDQVDSRLAKADELVGQADSAASPEEAAKLYDQAMRENPYRPDIAFKKAMKFHQARKTRELGIALGEVVKVEANNLAARNNLGVLAAQQGQWGTAMMNLSRASAVGDSDIILDNLDQVAVMAEAAGSAGGGEQHMRQVVARLHAAGKHVGENRWGNSWVSEQQYQRYLKDNADIDRQTAQNNGAIERLRVRRMKALMVKEEAERTRKRVSSGVITMTSADYQKLAEDAAKADKEIKDCETEAKKLQEESKALAGKKTVPPHAGKLVLLNADCSVLESLTVTQDTGKPDKPVQKTPGLFD